MEAAEGGIMAMETVGAMEAPMMMELSLSSCGRPPPLAAQQQLLPLLEGKRDAPRRTLPRAGTSHWRQGALV